MRFCLDARGDANRVEAVTGHQAETDKVPLSRQCCYSPRLGEHASAARSVDGRRSRSEADPAQHGDDRPQADWGGQLAAGQDDAWPRQIRCQRLYAISDPANLGLALEATETIIDEIEKLCPGAFCRIVTADADSAKILEEA